MPKVSVIIPTLDRAHLLRWSLKSAVEQVYGDLEILVCDDYSTDNTKEVVDSFDSKNIVYVKAPERLNMADTFEYALSRASGEYLHFLMDDCYLFPDCISSAMREMNAFNVKLAMWFFCGYVHSEWIESQRRNTLYIPKATYKSYLLNSRKILEKIFENTRYQTFPRSLNSLCHRSIIERAVDIQGRFFHYPCPDQSSGIGMLMNTPEFLVIDDFLHLDGVTAESVGPSQSFNFGKTAQEFYQSFGTKLADFTFLGIPVTHALNIMSFEKVGSFYPDRCLTQNMTNALGEIVDNLAKLQAYGSDVDAYWQVFNKHVATQSFNVKLAVIKRKLKAKLKWACVKMIRSSRYLYRLEGLIRGFKIMKGSKFKFSNIGECAKVANAQRAPFRGAGGTRMERK